MNDNFFLSRFLRHLKYFLIKNFYPYTALNDLDKKMKNFLNYENGYFLEIGANDGFRQSNTYYFEKKLNWKGILIEPILHKYIECKKNRSIKNKYFCNACVSFDHNEKFVKLLYSNLMTIPTNLQSDIYDKYEHANHSNIIKKNQEEVIEFFSKARTLNSILIECNAPKKIDFLSLDVEGAEIEVLKGIDFKNYEFKYILIESRKIEKISSFLSKHNYKFIEKLSYHDFIFILDK